MLCILFHLLLEKLSIYISNNAIKVNILEKIFWRLVDTVFAKLKKGCKNTTQCSVYFFLIYHGTIIHGLKAANCAIYYYHLRLSARLSCYEWSFLFVVETRKYLTVRFVLRLLGNRNSRVYFYPKHFAVGWRFNYLLIGGVKFYVWEIISQCFCFWKSQVR